MSLTAIGCEASLRGFRKVGCISPSSTVFEKSSMNIVDCECRNEFGKSIGLDKKDFGTIEYLLRKGQRQLEMYSSPRIKDIR